jgi:hypothetical protein
MARAARGRSSKRGQHRDQGQVLFFATCEIASIRFTILLTLDIASPASAVIAAMSHCQLQV